MQFTLKLTAFSCFDVFKICTTKNTDYIQRVQLLLFQSRCSGQYYLSTYTVDCCMTLLNIAHNNILQIPHSFYLISIFTSLEQSTAITPWPGMPSEYMIAKCLKSHLLDLSFCTCDAEHSLNHCIIIINYYYSYYTDVYNRISRAQTSAVRCVSAQSRHQTHDHDCHVTYNGQDCVEQQRLTELLVLYTACQRQPSDSHHWHTNTKLLLYHVLWWV